MTGNNKMRAAKFAQENKLFIECCKMANIPPTKRQVSKFRLERGKAFQMKGEVIRQGLIKEGKIKVTGEEENEKD